MKRLIVVLILSAFCFAATSAFCADKVVIIPLNSKKKSNVIKVATAGGDFSDPVSAVSAITDAAVDNPYLVAIGPGVYTLTEALVMKQYVNIAGAGESVTKLTGAISTATGDWPGSSIIVGADNASLSELTVENTGGLAYVVGIYNHIVNTEIHNVTVTATGGSLENRAILNSGGSPILENVTVSASGASTVGNTGIYNGFSTATMKNVSATGSEGPFCTGIGNHSSSSVTMEYVTAVAENCTTARAITNVQSEAHMKYIRANAAGFTSSYGIYNNQSSPTIEGSRASGLYGSSDNYGMYNLDGSSPVLSKSSLEGTTRGLYTESSTLIFPTVSQSTIIGGTGRSSVWVNYLCSLSNDGIGTILGADCNVTTP